MWRGKHLITLAPTMRDTLHALVLNNGKRKNHDCDHQSSLVSSSWDKLTPVTEEGTKLVCSSLFFLAFYKNRHKNRNGNEKAIHLRVERPCMSRRVSACLRPKTKRGEKLLL